MKTAIRTTLLGASLIAAAAAFGTAHAAVLPGFAGVSEFSGPCGLCDSTVNFAVYANTDGDWTNDGFFGGAVRTDLADLGGKFGATVDSNAAYVFMYQVLNTNQNGGVDDPLRDFNISIDSRAITGAGFFAGVFADQAGNPVGNANPTLADPNYVYGSGDTVPDNATPSALVSGAPLGIIVSQDAVGPDGVRTGLAISNPATPLSLDSIIYGWNVDRVLETGQTSGVVFFTSNAAPVYRWAETESQGGFGAANDVPSVPEPASVALLLAGLAGLGWARRRS